MADSHRKAPARAAGVGITPAQYREAERALRLMLARKFSAAWIATNYRELLSIANTEYVKWLQSNRPADNPAAWVVHNAMWRAANIVEAEARRPPPTSLDAVFHLKDEQAPDPEELAVEKDRRQRLGEALSHLPDKERELMTLVYFDDLTIREAGRALGWGKSSADRHHAAAMDRLRALVSDRDLWAPGGVVAALLALFRRIARSASQARTALERRAPELGGRFVSVGEVAQPVSGSGIGRFAAQCATAAAVAICTLTVAPAVEHVGSLLPIHHGSSQGPPPHSTPHPEDTSGAAPAEEPTSTEPGASSSGTVSRPAERAIGQARRHARHRRHVEARRRRKRAARRRRLAQQRRARAAAARASQALEEEELRQAEAEAATEEEAPEEEVTPGAELAPGGGESEKKGPTKPVEEFGN